MDYHLRHLERLYRATESAEIGAQLINVYLRRGETLQDLKHRFHASLLWDTCMGYEPGKTEKLVASISGRLDTMGWRFDRLDTMVVGVERGQAFFRAIWNSLEIPFLMDDWRLPGEKQTLVLEELPSVFLDPTLNVGGIKVAGSGGRNSSFFSSTKRVSVADVSATLTIVEECAYNIFNGSVTGPEQERYSGAGLYQAEEDPSSEQENCSPEQMSET